MRSVGSHRISGRDTEGKPAFHGAISCSKKRFKLVWRCHQLLFGFLAKSHLPEYQVRHLSKEGKSAITLEDCMEADFELRHTMSQLYTVFPLKYVGPGVLKNPVQTLYAFSVRKNVEDTTSCQISHYKTP